MSEAFTDIAGVRHGDRALVLNPVLKADRFRGSDDEALLEAEGLARAIDLEIVHEATVALARTVPATLLGAGQVEQYAAFIQDEKIIVTVINHTLTPVQQRNLERQLKCKVIDRTGLILEIFGDRARTKEGKLQVELAALEYQKSRLVRSWTHLERQRGGFGFMGGPGESQLEVDRRMITDRIARLKEDLEKVRRTRGLQREARQRAEHPTVALVGYTNAGKSTLFNRLTGAEVLVKDMLFATLDPTMRGITLPQGHKVVLSDTVGFISDLPTTLVEAFRATLEEVQLADVILHVRDVAHPYAKDQREAVLAVLAELGIEANDERLIDVQNKIDRLPEDERKLLAKFSGRVLKDDDKARALGTLHVEASGGMVAVSALSGEGLPELLALIEKRLRLRRRTYTIELDPTEGAALSWLHDHGRVVAREDGDSGMTLRVELEIADYGRFRTKFKKSGEKK